MLPVPHLNVAAMAVSILANMFIGFLWFGPIFGKAWAKEMKMSMDVKPPASVMVKAMILMLIGTFLLVFVFAHNCEVWRPSAWNAGPDGSPALRGFLGGFFTWLGFYVPIYLNQVAWEMRSWKLFAINAGYYFVVLQVIGMILAFWHQ